MILKNPIEQTVTITYLGKDMSIAPGKTISISDDAGIFWKKTHGFLIQVDKLDEVEIKEDVKEESKEVAKPKEIKETKAVTKSNK